MKKLLDFLIDILILFFCNVENDFFIWNSINLFTFLLKAKSVKSVECLERGNVFIIEVDD